MESIVSYFANVGIDFVSFLKYILEILFCMWYHSQKEGGIRYGNLSDIPGREKKSIYFKL